MGIKAVDARTPLTLSSKKEAKSSAMWPRVSSRDTSPSVSWNVRNKRRVFKCCIYSLQFRCASNCLECPIFHKLCWVVQCCYDYRRYDFYRDISEILYHIFITIFPVHAERYVCAALALCKHDRFTTSLLKFQHASITCCERRDACDCRPGTVDEQRLHPWKMPQLPLK